MDYNNIKLEKGMYNICNKSFTSVLEELDPSDKYKGTSLEGLDAYQRQLKRFGIKVSGPNCDTVEKFFSASDSSVLFPEFIARAVRQGIYSHNILPNKKEEKSVIDTIDYRTITSEVISSSETPGTNTNYPDEEKTLPSVKIKVSNLISLKKHGRLLSSTYEALRFQNLDVLAVILRKIGSDIVNEQLNDAITAIKTGVTPTEVEEISYAALLQLWSSLKPYNMNVMITTYDVAKDILALSEMRDSNAGLNFQGTGKDITPVGAKLICSSTVDSDTIIGLDKDCALQMIQSGDIVIDYDKVIDKQLERAAISVTAGFSKIFSSAIKAISISSNNG